MMNPGRAVLSLILGLVLIAVQTVVLAHDATLQTDEAVADTLYNYEHGTDF